MNTIILSGNIVRDVITHTTDNGTLILNNAIAVARETKDKGTDFFEFTAFGHSAEFIKNYAEKGNKILICGKLQTNEFVKKDGTKTKSISVIVDRVELLQKSTETKVEEPHEPLKTTEQMLDPLSAIDDKLPF